MVKHCVTTVEDETQRRKMSEAKGRGVQSDKLIPLYFESDLVDGFKLPQTEVDAEMLRGCNEARTAANMCINLESQSADGTLAAKVLAIKEKTFFSLRTWQAVLAKLCFLKRFFQLCLQLNSLALLRIPWRSLDLSLHLSSSLFLVGRLSRALL